MLSAPLCCSLLPSPKTPSTSVSRVRSAELLRDEKPGIARLICFKSLAPHRDTSFIELLGPTLLACHQHNLKNLPPRSPCRSESRASMPAPITFSATPLNGPANFGATITGVDLNNLSGERALQHLPKGRV